MALIEIKNLSFQYPVAQSMALDHINLSIEEGEFVVFCGTTGCGKSSLLRQFKKEIAPHGEKTGEIQYKGLSIDDVDFLTASSEIGFVMQNPDNQIVTDKVWHELAFGLENLGVSTKEIRRRVAEMANFFGIHQWFRKSTSELSGGQKQILNLASIMVMQPKVLILDEPTSQLDPIAATEFIGILQRLNKDLGLTILLVEHRLEEVFPIADRVVVMESGRILLNNEPQFVVQGLKQRDINHPMMLGMPCSVRVYNALQLEGHCPLTVRDGRRWLTKHFRNKVTAIDNPIQEKKKDNSVILQLKETWFRYEREGTDILRGFSMDIREGEILSIVGGNGTGKTTALNVMVGLHKPYRGKVLLNGKKLTKYSHSELFRNNLAVLPQDPQSLFVDNKVRKEFTTVLRNLRYSEAEAQDKIDEITGILRIRHLLDSHPYDLSGGEQQKVALAKILLLNPRIILLDEPTKAIDAYSKVILAEILLELKMRGVAIVLVTHDIEFSAQYSDRCAMFFDGNIVSEDCAKDFYSGNSFYTTAAHRMSKHLYANAVTCEDVITLCRHNQKPLLIKG